MTKFQERVRLNAFLVASLNKAGVSAKITAATKTTADCNGKVVELEAVNGEQYICRCGGITSIPYWFGEGESVSSDVKTIANWL